MRIVRYHFRARRKQQGARIDNEEFRGSSFHLGSNVGENAVGFQLNEVAIVARQVTGVFDILGRLKRFPQV